MEAKDDVERLESDLIGLFRQLSSLQAEIQQRLMLEADGKTLKGNELVGWLGEIYGKILLGGRLVSDREEHDFVCPGDRRVSVKTRKGWGSGWKQTSAIPKIDGEECPTDLMFVHLNDDYAIDRIWLYSWNGLFDDGRFTSHVVRGQHRSTYLEWMSGVTGNMSSIQVRLTIRRRRDGPDGSRPELNRRKAH